MLHENNLVLGVRAIGPILQTAEQFISTALVSPSLYCNHQADESLFNMPKAAERSPQLSAASAA